MAALGKGFKSKIDYLDADGLPKVGTFLTKKMVLYSYRDFDYGGYKEVLYEGDESAYVDQVRMLRDDFNPVGRTMASIILRINRVPDIGDKFAARHGQKGVCSMLIDAEDMPFFEETGMIPDILFNPHGYPTRMTIGMMLETMAAKAGAALGVKIDATPFRHLKRPVICLIYIFQQDFNSKKNYLSSFVENLRFLSLKIFLDKIKSLNLVF